MWNWTDIHKSGNKLPMLNDAIIKYWLYLHAKFNKRLEILIKKCTNQHRKKHNLVRENEETIERRWQRDITTNQRQTTFKKEGLLSMLISTSQLHPQLNIFQQIELSKRESWSTMLIFQLVNEGKSLQFMKGSIKW